MVPKNVSINECSFDGCTKPRRAKGLCNAHRMQMSKNGVLKPLQQWTRSLPEDERFWEKVDRRSSVECWEWQAAVNIHGYGFLKQGGKIRQAHRAAYVMAHGEVREGLEVDHICRNRICVNPSHLRGVTRKQNSENHGGAQRNSTSGVRGVSWQKSTRKWKAMVTSNGESTSRYFAEFRDAAAAVVEMRNEAFTHNNIDRVNSK